MDEYFCTKCGAILNYQSGFTPDCSAWRCTECGQMLMDDDVYDGDKYEGVAWFCDECGVLLNKQDGFSDSYGSWTCTECGYNNSTTEDDIINNDAGPECPSCGGYLNKQFCFGGYENDWECTECGARLHREYSFDEFSIAEESEEDDDMDNDDYPEDEINEFECPGCGALLNEQDEFDNEENEWICTECGVRLHHDYSLEIYDIVNEDCYENDADNESLNDKEILSKPINNNEENSMSKNNIQRNEEKGNSIVEKIKRIALLIFNGKKIKVGINSEDIIGKNVNEAVRIFKDKGFSNVEEQAIQDIYIDNVKKVGEVERVILDDKINFFEKEMFPYDSKIIITYHTKKKIAFPFSSKQLHRRNHKELRKELEELGFTNIKEKAINDLITGWIVKDGSIEEVSVNYSNSYKKGKVCEYDAEIVIKYHTFSKKR